MAKKREVYRGHNEPWARQLVHDLNAMNHKAIMEKKGNEIYVYRL